MTKNVVKTEAVVIESVKGGKFRLKEKNTKAPIMGYLSARLRKAKIWIVPGDTVEVELSPYDLSQGRITWRK